MMARMKADTAETLENPVFLNLCCFIAIVLNSLLIIACFITLFSLPFVKDFMPVNITPENELLYMTGAGIMALIYISSLFASFLLIQLKLSGFILFSISSLIMITALVMVINTKFAVELHYWMLGTHVFLQAGVTMYIKKFRW